MISVDEQLSVISKGADEIIDTGDLRRKIERSITSGVPLRVKLGLDPTAPDIHLGHTVVLRKIRQFQDLGHTAVIIIGDFTGAIGDPTGRSSARKQLSREDVLRNSRTYEEQIFRVLDRNKTEIRFNSEWLSPLGFPDVIRLASHCTVARMLERDDFRSRFEGHKSIGIHEFFYPLMQGYDSVAVQSDVELGGTEQKFNILMGRTLQKDYGMESQVAIFMPILEGLDGVQKMSKSLGNYVGINDEPQDMYGKIMSIPDSLIVRYFELATDISPAGLDTIKQALISGENPRDIKARLALEITALYSGHDAAAAARSRFEAVFRRRELPSDISGYDVPESIVSADGADMPKLLVAMGFASSTSEARRLISQGAVRVNGEKINALALPLRSGDVVQAGRLKYGRIT
jgi:tyrosyl-tRNA synthetase